MREYSAEEIAIAVSNREITIYELKKTGQFTPRLEAKVKKYLSGELPLPQPEPATAAVPEQTVINTPDTPPAAQPSKAWQPESALEPEHRAQPAPPEISAPQPPEPPKQPVFPPQPPAAPRQAAPQPQYQPYPPQQPYPGMYQGGYGVNSGANQYMSRPGMFSAPFSFQGRIRRLEFNLSLLIYFVIYSIMISIIAYIATMTSYNPAIALMMGIVYIVCGWFMLAQGCKRCHDLGHSGWWQLIPFYCFWLMFDNSQPGDNEYGPYPK